MLVSPSLLLYSSLVGELAPPLAALVSRTRDRARIGIVVWCLLLFVGNIAARLWVLVRHENNLFFVYISDAVSGALLLWVLSLWQVRALPALALRLLIPFYLVANLVLILAAEDLTRFSRVTSTLNGALLLSLVLFTLISRSLDERVLLTQFDWFWICCGLVVYLAKDMVLLPAARLLVENQMATLATVITAAAVVEAIVMLVIARGILCPTQHLPSGGFSSPPSSPPLSSS